MTLEEEALPAPRSRRGLLLAGLLSAVLLALFLWLNLTPRHHPGFQDLRNPLAEAWSPDPRAERGWPFTAHRQFEQPSEVNARGVWDLLGLVLDLGLLVGSLGLIWLVVWYLALRARRPKG